MKKSFGKATLGGGNKMSVHLHGYGRSTHNLNKVVRTTMNVGTLIPLYTNIGLNGDTWDIDLNALIKTKPAIAPLFGTYKYQVDVFTADMRLYVSALHNNPLNVGLNMQKVKLPMMAFKDQNAPVNFDPSSLVAYLGVRGLQANENEKPVSFNAIPMLAYYEIFKNYYANKQEKQAYVISTNLSTVQTFFVRMAYETDSGLTYVYPKSNTSIYTNIPWKQKVILRLTNAQYLREWINIYQSNEAIRFGDLGRAGILNIGSATTLQYNATPINNGKEWDIEFFNVKTTVEANTNQIEFMGISQNGGVTEDYKLTPFQLDNIDDMRQKILNTPFYQQVIISQTDQLPYSANLQNGVNTDTGNTMFNAERQQNGICVKTFQSDIYQNWLNTEWVDGVNGISEITKVDTSNGLNLDALNLAQKVYNMLNRVAVSGGSWEDWQEAVYGNNAIRRAESPVYHGGMSCRIGFEEVTSNASANDATGDNQPLGTLAGKGQLFGKKGGRVTIHVKEPCVIMVIASITPYIDYSQGNKWFMEELNTIDDLHKPALDGIGFQNLPQYQLRGDAKRGVNVGKSPAWIHYMTDVNECYGGFAIGGSERYMTLQKEFEKDASENITNTTTYIDPTQFNYTFADKSLAAQNFWVQQALDIKCRRIMSAKVIPNL